MIKGGAGYKKCWKHGQVTMPWLNQPLVDNHVT